MTLTMDGAVTIQCTSIAYAKSGRGEVARDTLAMTDRTASVLVGQCTTCRVIAPCEKALLDDSCEDEWGRLLG